MDAKRYKKQIARLLMCRTGRLGRWVLERVVPPRYGRVPLARLNAAGYVSRRALIHHPQLRIGKHCFIDDGVYIYQDTEGGSVALHDGVHLHWDTVILTGQGGSVVIGAHTGVQPGCQINAYKATVRIGEHVMIAPKCAFYPYDHGVDVGVRISEQPLQTKGDIVVGNDVWLGFGVIVLGGVRIGTGAVIGAGAVVSHDIPEGGIAVGVPARVVRWRGGGEARLAGPRQASRAR